MQVWRIGLPSTLPEECLCGLSRDELERYHRLIPPNKKIQFAWTRYALRKILGQHLGLEAQRVSFVSGLDGKPALAPGLGQGTRIEFNVSHSGELALCVLAANRTVGIDVEQLDMTRPFLVLAQRFFSREEATQLAALPPEALPHAFYRCWTAKEAYIKALGKGLRLPLDSFSVEIRPDYPPGLHRSERKDERDWSFHSLPIQEDFVATLVVQGLAGNVCLFEFPSPLG